jgi:protein-tyrosine-phosphatase
MHRVLILCAYYSARSHMAEGVTRQTVRAARVDVEVFSPAGPRRTPSGGKRRP